MIDHIHDPDAKNWVAAADVRRDFTVRNLPLGLFQSGNDSPRCFVAGRDRVALAKIGEKIALRRIGKPQDALGPCSPASPT